MVRSFGLVLGLLGLACSGGGDDDEDDSGQGGDQTSLGAAAAELLQAHNEVRATVDVAPLTYDATVEATAQTWARSLAADNCAFEHEDQDSYGENLWFSSFDPTPTEVVEAWASEVAFYDYDRNSCERGEVCGHYTQIVWADSEKLGCGKGVCEDGSVLWACRYDPPGNWVGEKPY